MASKKRKALYGLLGILLVLVAARIALPFVVKWYLNNRVLNKMEHYRGHVDDVDIALLRGAYVINDLVIVKINGENEDPFVLAPKIDLSVQWKHIWEGEIVGEVVAYDPTVNFAFSKDKDEEQTGAEQDWTEVIKSLLPIRINRFAVKEGTVALVGLFDIDDTDLAFNELDLEVTNIQNTVTAEDPALPSDIKATANATGYGGVFHLDAKAMLLKNIPDFDYNASLEKAELTELNSIFEYYTGMTFERGTLNLYTEMAMDDGAFEGYFKPLLDKPLIFGWKEDDRSVGQWFKEFFSEGIKEIFKNQKEQQVATRIPLSGDLGDVNTSVWTAIIQAFRNAYVKAFEGQIDGTIDFDDVQEGSQEKEELTPQEKREERQAERQERREERQEKREERREERQEKKQAMD